MSYHVVLLLLVIGRQQFVLYKKISFLYFFFEKVYSICCSFIHELQMFYNEISIGTGCQAAPDLKIKRSQICEGNTALFVCSNFIQHFIFLVLDGDYGHETHTQTLSVLLQSRGTWQLSVLIMDAWTKQVAPQGNLLIRFQMSSVFNKHLTASCRPGEELTPEFLPKWHYSVLAKR